MKGNPPHEVIRDGNLKASLWQNTNSENKPYFTTSFAKTYRSRDGQIRDTSVFNNNDLLRISELARQAYGRTNELRQEIYQQNTNTHEDSQAQAIEQAPAPQQASSQEQATQKEPEHTPEHSMDH